jgi:biopolymer transport protein ExbB
MELIHSAGPVFYPLALCSLFATTITIERLISLRRSRVLPREIVEVVHAVRHGRDMSVALEVCRRNPGVLSDIVRAGLEHSAEPTDVMRDALLDAGRQRTPLLERHLVWLQTIAQASPLLGLFGTVLGMRHMFHSISFAGLGDPRALSGGISEAIVTTILGLAIGIPTLAAYNLLAARAETLTTEIETLASHLLVQLRPPQSAGDAA